MADKNEEEERRNHRAKI